MTGEPRVQYKREYWVLPNCGLDRYLQACERAYADRRTIGFSYDDAGVGALQDKKAVLLDIPEIERQKFIDWYDTNYPGTKVEFFPMPMPPLRNSPRVSQRWGENYEYYMREFGLPGHNGIDYAVVIGTPVYATQDGWLKETGYHPNGYGNYIILKHEGGLETIYAHFDKEPARQDGYRTGTLLGYSGNTGNSTGPHLHFGVRKDGKYINPEDYLGKQ